MECVKCYSKHVQKDGNHNGFQRYKCLDCKKRFDFGEYPYLYKYIVHFNVKIKETEYNKITRNNYCEPTNKISYKLKKYLEENIKNDNYKIPNAIYLDCETYSNEYVKEHYDDCMHNYDLNMNYFSKLNHKEFNEYLNSYILKNKFIEITDLNEVNGIEGIYIIVLDKYNQVYIGKANNIKKRIMQHWNNRKEFDRLIFGSPDTSILSIDSFGALDTTRLYYKKLKWFQEIDIQEEKYVSKFKEKYKLNRVSGGLNAMENSIIRNIKLLSSASKRNFL